ncbi:3-hydroxybutyrate dehydrogenase [Caldimonas aquatica]|uniref:3-hydroxybutyrate dehydrogenase n=1 Tax=Caldimonas aquatica TaxID=376175 RepID=A0ABY6MNH8_9BURK|nr:3-hydroxybutyrate dehydrogenase [Schlegelella aquatica]UZD54064.1 3-hydroxybutyrate dehydrogenase [Schlegelella aquatica]
MDDTFLKGRTALVTGSVQGIGLAIAERLARAGAAIVLHGLATQAQAAEAEAALRCAGAEDVLFLDHDLRAPAAVEALMDRALGWRGGLDVLVNNAGIQFTAPIVEMPPQRWDAILAINLTAAFHTMRRALPGMLERGYGRVVNIASVHGLVASMHKAPYVAAKFGLVGLTRVAALECAAAGTRDSGGVTANCIAPGWTETAIIEPQIVARAVQLGIDRDAAVRDLLREKQPSLRTSRPSEIAEVAAMLCRPWAHNINGITLPVDGGWTAQ